jgi:hypothetical protein
LHYLVIYSIIEDIIGERTLEYLCHYTNNKSAYMILQNMSLRFGKVCNSNDPIESVDFFVDLNYRDLEESIKDGKRKKMKMDKYLKNILQFLCFSKGNIMDINGDMEEDGEEVDIVNDIIHFADLKDFSSRPPYFFPRMWAQYSKNSKGVCLIFNKIKLIEQLEKQVENSYHLTHKKIIYKDMFKNDFMFKQAISSNYTDIHSKIESQNFVQNYLFNNNIKNYFTKDINWHDENEYRFLIWNKFDNINYDNKVISINNESLIGIVFGFYNNDKKLIELARARKIKNVLQLRREVALLCICKIEK